jgi:hypothetical protein
LNHYVDFPPRISHKFQSLDGYIFGLFKNITTAVRSNWMLTNPGKQISTNSVGHLIGVAHPSAFNPWYMQSGFHVSGLWPVNADIFRDDEYLNAYVIGINLQIIKCKQNTPNTCNKHK